MNHEKAIEEFKRAIKLNPKFGLSYIRCCYAQYNFAKQKSNVLDTEIFLKNLSKCMIKYPNIAENYILYTHVKVNIFHYFIIVIIFKNILTTLLRFCLKKSPIKRPILYLKKCMICILKTLISLYTEVKIYFLIFDFLNYINSKLFF